MVGCGPGGLSAALAASRTGISVILVERFGFFDGNITAVGVEGFAWYRHEGTIDSEGIDREFENRAIEMGATAPEPKSDSHTLDGEAFKVVADNMVLEAGIMPWKKVSRQCLLNEDGYSRWGLKGGCSMFFLRRFWRYYPIRLKPHFWAF